MRLPDTAAGDEVYAKCIDYFEGAVEAWSDAEVLTAEQRKAILSAGAIVHNAGTAFHARLAACDLAARNATKLRSRYTIRDIILDMRVIGVSDLLLNGPARRDRRSPLYKSVFAEGNPGEINESRTRDDPEIAQRISERLRRLDHFEGKEEVQTELDIALAKIFVTRDLLEEADFAENKAGDSQILARLEVRKSLEQAYGVLRAAFPEQRKLVESFFYRPRRERMEKKDEDVSSPDES